MNLLITGNSGFIGKNVVAFLKNKENRILSFLGRNTTPNWDTITEIGANKIIIHLSGLAHDMDKLCVEDDYIKANFKLTKQLYDLFLDSKYSTTFIFISTIAVRHRHSGIFKEDDETNAVSFYGKSKRMAEEYILNNLSKNKNVYILRPVMVHGEGNKGNLNLLYDFVKKGIPYPLGAYDNSRSFLGIDNLCFIINELIEREDIPSGIYHLADDTPVSTENLIKLISQVIHKKIFILKIPKFIINVIANFGDFIPLLINTERVMKMTENYIVSNQKIKIALGKNLPVSSEDGLRKTIESFEK